MAVLFLVTSAAFSILVIWTMIDQSRQDKKSKSDAQSQQAEPKNKTVGTKMKDFKPVAKVPKLEKIDKQKGTGAAVKASDTVTVIYTGAVASTGVIFDSSLDSGQPATFPLNGVIKGWTEGIPGMQQGGTRRLLIPADMAYGKTPPPGSNIPPNADLVFDVTLLKIGK